MSIIKRNAVSKSVYLLAVVVFLFSMFLLSIILNIAIARATIGFIYLTLVPGFLFLRLLKIKKLDITETVVFSVGLSLVFLMVVGLFSDRLYPFVGVIYPLSSIPLITMLSVTILVLCIFDYFRSEKITSNSSEKVQLGAGKFKILTLLCVFVFLSILGNLLGGFFTGTNPILLALLLGVAALLIFSQFKGLLSSTYYPVIIFTIALALLWHSSLVSTHLNGFDIQHEYLFMERTVSLSKWDPNLYDKFQSLLSITIMPVEYWNFLNMDGVWILKLIYPIIFAFVPVILYKLYGIWLDKRMAFLSIFFLIANSIFYSDMLTLGRQMIAEFFFVLLFFILFTNKITESKKVVLFTIFSFALVASHYAVAEIFMVLLGISWLFVYIFRRRTAFIGSIKIYHVTIFSVILFSWYIYISSAATFDELTRVFDFVFQNTFANFFDFGSRGSTVMLGVGVGNVPTSFINLIGRMWAYITELLLIVGFIYVLIKRQRIFNNEFFILLAVNLSLIVLSIVLPGFAGSLGMNRLYHIVLLLASPLISVGIYGLSRAFPFLKSKRGTCSLALVILIPFFLFQSGVIYEVAHVQNYSIPLSEYRFNSIEYYNLGMIEQTDISGINWLSSHELNGSAKVVSDALADSILVRAGYGLFPLNRTEGVVSNTTIINSNSIVYLRYYNFKYNLLPTFSGELNATYYYDLSLKNANVVYSSGMCKMFQKP